MDNLTMILNDRYSEIVMPNTVLIILGTAIGVFGNTTILIFYLFRLKDKHGERYFIPVLACVDLLGVVGGAAYYLMDNIVFFVYPSDGLCHFLSFFLTVTSGFSASTLSAIALQRYLLICRPFGKQMTLSLRRLAVAVIFTVSFTYSSPLLSISGIRTSNRIFLNHNVTAHMCVLSVNDTTFSVIYFGLLLVFAVTNIIIATALYVPVARSIYGYYHRLKDRRESRVKVSRDTTNDTNISRISNIGIGRSIEMETFSSSSKDDEAFEIDMEPSFKETEKLKTRMNIVFLIIILCYVFSYLPTAMLLIYTYSVPQFDFLQFTEFGINMWISVSRLVFLSHIVNPFIYSYFDGKLKLELRRIFSVMKNKLSQHLECHCQ